jgi:hypothetical protein
MSSKLELDVSQQSTLVLRYQDTGNIDIQITDATGVVQSLHGCTFTLDVHRRDYTIANSLTATLDAGEVIASFAIDITFWNSIDLCDKYCFRIRRQVADEIKTIVNGEVNING